MHTAQKGILQLVTDDLPLAGRIVALEGQALAGVRVALAEIWASPGGDLDDFETAAKAKAADFYSQSRTMTVQLNGAIVSLLATPVATDADGRFTLHGIGRDRIAVVAQRAGC